ncbi:CoA-disulfide reductase [Flexistipes sinusarabici DSM 4947]|uniref:CoA-disulfide reductase n=2 Tax=Flexistipes sinusarabici TaxID=2352 RepID=F8E8M9_FLESM|nr:FAD-dependent oxidoreductase [Flexistipes sinusarabici]AEI15152.1 CoA-disulfide reductase [Flexistipes sinusarabici DSM 4947]HCW92535.1 pyridine nucleotide-disulfide oxidoreductase [Flexistipes sinusarabici]
MKVLVIGGGPGGIQSTKTLKAHNPEIDVTVIRPEPYSVIYCALPYVVEDLVDRQKVRKSDNLITETGATLVKDKAVNVDFENKVVKTELSGNYNYDKLIISTGATPFIPPIDGGELKNVVSVKTESDLDQILECVEKGAEKAVVVGAGNIGIEMSVALKHKGIETYLVEMQDRVVPNMLSKELSKLPEKEIVELGINLKLNVAVDELTGKERVEKVKLSNNESITLAENDMVIMCVGVKPNVEIFKNSPLEIDNDGIKVNEYMETNIEDVYAVGDCTSYISYIDKKPLGGKLATNAVPMAKICAYRILGKNYSYPGFINGAITKCVNWRMGGTGFSEEMARQRGFDIMTAVGETTTRFPMIPGATKVYVKLIAEKNTLRILGAEVVAGESVPQFIDVISFAIQKNSTAYDLFQFSYCAQPFQTFFPASNAIVQAAEKLLNS